jgi:hypothetical protein
MMDQTGEERSLKGQVFLVRHENWAVPMLVERDELGWCYCKSLDLEYVRRWPSDAVRREIQRQHAETLNG